MTKVTFDTKFQRERYMNTVKELRARNFKRNLPFLILSDELPDGQVYREFPDGRIEVQQVSIQGAEYDSTVVRILLPSDAERVRREHELR